VLTCLLDEETIKGSHHETAARVAELAARLSLANAAAFTFQHMPLPSNPAPASGNTAGVSHPQQVAEALLSSMHNQAATAQGPEYGYFLAPAAAPAVTSAVATVPVDSGSALRISPISPAATNDNSGTSSWDPKRHVEDIAIVERQKNGEVDHGSNVVPVLNAPRKAGRRVDTVAKTLAAIKASNSLTPRSDSTGSYQSGSLPLTPSTQPPESPSNHVKLPDIQTLAQRLPSFHQTALDIKPVIPSAASADAVGGEAWQVVPSSKAPLQSPELEVSVDATAGVEIGTGGKKKFQCMFCGIYLSTKCYLKNHINAVHTRSRVYQCDLCAHYFYSAGAARIHKLRNHWHGAKKHRCSECAETFLLPIELRKHIQKKHCGTPAYQLMMDSSKLEPGEVLPAVSATNLSILGGGSSSTVDGSEPTSVE